VPIMQVSSLLETVCASMCACAYLCVCVWNSGKSIININRSCFQSLNLLVTSGPYITF